MTMAQVEEELRSVTVKIDELRSRISEYDKQPDAKIRSADLNEAIKQLMPQYEEGDQDMIWEVDENLDGCVDWEEFKLMFIATLQTRPASNLFSCSMSSSSCTTAMARDK